MSPKTEFDNIEEYHQAINNLSTYHDCDKCHGKIVCIKADEFGNTKCGYCGEIVKYPKLNREIFEKYLKTQ